jgi:hypothetical protein
VSEFWVGFWSFFMGLRDGSLERVSGFALAVLTFNVVGEAVLTLLKAVIEGIRK